MPSTLSIRPQLVSLLLLVSCLLVAMVSVLYPVTGHLYVNSRAKYTPYVFPAGGRTLFPHYRLVSLYGTPDVPQLGALGAQDSVASVARVKALAAQYQPLTAQTILPSFEIIATVASSSPTENSDYSYEIDSPKLQQWIAVARDNGVYIVLDLQPGRSDFLTQAKSIEPLLAEPNVGLALDPEWRLRSDQLPLQQIGSVDIGEVNDTAHWLASLVRSHHLPQKLFLLHQFRLDMIPDRAQLDTSQSELAYAIQMDGQGTQLAKLNTWDTIMSNPPANVYFGWKNFYEKDSPIRSPQDTFALNPQPWYVSYQ